MDEEEQKLKYTQYTLFVALGEGRRSATEIEESLKSDDDSVKIKAMKEVIILLVNGETLPQLLSTIIEFVSPSKNSTVQRLLLLYLENVERSNEEGKLLPEMLWIRGFLRRSLQDWYIYTFRSLCRFREFDLDQSIIYLVLLHLRDPDPYIRRRVIVALRAIYKLAKVEEVEFFLPAYEWIQEVFDSEQDQFAKRDAFLLLLACDQDRAVDFMIMNFDKDPFSGEPIRLVVLELMKEVVYMLSVENGKEVETFLIGETKLPHNLTLVVWSIYKRMVEGFLLDASPKVAYESANTLISSFSDNTLLITDAAHTYAQIVVLQRDNIVNLIVLDRLIELKSSHEDIMVDEIVFVLHNLCPPDLKKILVMVEKLYSSLDFDILRKILDSFLELVTAKNIDKVVLTIKVVLKTRSGELEKNGEYLVETKREELKFQKMLLKAIYSSATKFPTVDSVHVLMDFLGDSNVSTAIHAVGVVQDIMKSNPKLRPSIITRLLDTFYLIRAGWVCSRGLWIIKECCESDSEIEHAISTIKGCLSDMVPEEGQGNLKLLLLSGNFSLGAVVAYTLAELVDRLRNPECPKSEVNKAAKDQAILIMLHMLHLEEDSSPSDQIKSDTKNRIVWCMRFLLTTGDEHRQELLKLCLTKFLKDLSHTLFLETEAVKEKASENHQLDTLLRGSIKKETKGKEKAQTLHQQMQSEDSMKRYAEIFLNERFSKYQGAKLNRILHLTSFGRPVYAEAHVILHQTYITLHVTVINQTKETLQNLCLELKLKTTDNSELLERSQEFTLDPESSMQVETNFRRPSTEARLIKGTIHYVSSVGSTGVTLDDIGINTADFISPKKLSEDSFKKMWAALSNYCEAIDIQIPMQDKDMFAEYVNKVMNMECISIAGTNSGASLVQLYAKSVFGEDVLVVMVTTLIRTRIHVKMRIESSAPGITLRVKDEINRRWGIN